MKKIYDKGFTLVELLAVISMLAIIMTIAYPIIGSIINNSKENAYETSIKMVEDAAKLYVANNNKAESVTLQTLVDEGYLKKIPVDPRTNENMAGLVLLSSEGQAEYVSDNVVSTYNGTHNKPVIEGNMYPVKWNGTNWVVTDTDDADWYKYNADEDIDNSGDTDKDDGEGAFTADKWANVQITTDSLSVGDILNESALNLYVWIPRYTYLLNEGVKTIAIKYSNETTDDTSGEYLSHPAFTFGSEELTGIWVAKFEMSADNQSITNDYGKPSGETVGVSRPNVKPWRQISVNDVFNEARTIETEYLLNADSHMIKSSEWAAVAYLAEAIRDGEEIWKNNQGWYDTNSPAPNYKYIVTGCASSTVKNERVTNRMFVSCISGYDYDSAGVKASTTGNVYGIYDMVGGSWEFVATYINDNTNNILTSSIYAKALVDADDKYKEMFDVSGATDTTNYNNASDMTLGLAIHETSTTGYGTTSWYSDCSYFPYANYPIVRRGGNFSSTLSSGVFALSRTNGGSEYMTFGWRAVIVN